MKLLCMCMGEGCAMYPRWILLALAGLSPQVVTETVYALVVAATPFVPTEIHLVTTADGAERARLTLLGSSPGWFHRLCEEYSLEGIRFDRDSIHVLTAADGTPLSDIRSAEDNVSAADQIAELVRRFTEDPEAALHVSIAGGRKTMGFFAGYALSMFARPQDRLSHVLVSAPFESHPDFFYPTRESRIIYTPPPDTRPLDTAAAQVTLAEIPFLRLRNWLPGDLLKEGGSFASLIRAAQGTLASPGLVFDLENRSLRAGGVRLRLPPAEIAFLSWFARRRLRDAPPLACPSEGVPEQEHAAEFLEEYRLTGPGAASESRTRRALAGGMEKSFFLEHKSRLQRALRRALGPRAGLYAPQPVGRRPDTRYQLALAPEQIRYEKEPCL